MTGDTNNKSDGKSDDEQKISIEKPGYRNKIYLNDDRTQFGANVKKYMDGA